MKIKIEKRYLVFPTNSKMKNKNITFSVSSKKLYDLRCKLDNISPDFYAYIDVSEYIGKELEISVSPKMQINCTQADEMAKDEENIAVRRPRFHFTTTNGWLNDPNGLVYLNGKYHMFYQYNPADTVWENMHWGHAVSEDLMHWEEKDVALFPDDSGMMFSGSAIVDFGESDVYFGLGDLTDKIIKVDGDKMALTPEVIAKAAPDAKVVKKLAEKYIKIVFENITDVSEEKEEISVKGIEQKLTALTYSISEETIADISKAVLKELKDDKDVKDIIKNAQKVLVDAEVIDGGDYYGDFKEAIEDALEEIKEQDEFDDEEMLEIVTYVNGASEIVGRRIVVEDENVFEYVFVRDGSEVAAKCVVNANGSKMSLAGSGEVKSNKLALNLDLKVDDTKYATIKISDYDLKADKKGYINANIKVPIVACICKTVRIKDL